MMDIYCYRCGEPWELPLEMTSKEQIKFHAHEGCPCCIDEKIDKIPDHSIIQGVVQDLLGDDIDGISSAMDDYFYTQGEGR